MLMTQIQQTLQQMFINQKINHKTKKTNTRSVYHVSNEKEESGKIIQPKKWDY